MRRSPDRLNTAVAALGVLLALGPAVPLNAQGAGGPDPSTAAGRPGAEAELDMLFERLRQPDLEDWKTVEEEIWNRWSRSGSPALDLLLERGRMALANGDFRAAIEHLTALVDHAPDFAEGWNARATAYFHAGYYGPAVADIMKTLSLNPRHFGALSGLGLILEETGDPDGALAAYRRAFALHPHRPDVRAAIERLEKETGGQEL